ncbi:MAG: RES family NAD+ phosphorylase [Trueperaceae bacterium]|nr:RES family NAD+ phosphorylase [Trueperaceae bacterium]
MMLFRHTHPNFPFLWEDSAQPAARWHAAGEGLVHYFATTADGAWAELLRHEEIVEPEDLEGIARRAMWVVTVDVPESGLDEPVLPADVLTGDTATHVACQREARRLREGGSVGLRAPSAALRPGGAVRLTFDGGQRFERLGSEVVVLFGSHPSLTAQLVSIGGRPDARLLEFVRRL